MDWSFLTKRKTDTLCVSTDTRNLPQGCVFFALHGDSFDGNTFAAQALEMGAEYAVVDRELQLTCSQNKDYCQRFIRVPDTLRALQELAREWRRELGIPVLGITGTNGKTTTKELCAAVLSTKYKLYYTQGNLNNQIGVPLTLLNITRAHEMAIVEMGASHPGDIKELVEIAEPTHGLITNVGRAHLQGFGSFEGVMRTKSELYDYLTAHGGTVFRNADNPYLGKMLADSLMRCPSGPADVQMVNDKIINYHTGTMPEGTHLVGGYNAENVSAAVCVGRYFGVSEEDALGAIRAYVPSNNRSQLLHTDHNTVVVDAYNANPTSMTAAINAFSNDPAANGRMENVYILGGMRELGEYSQLEHQNIVNMLLERKADRVLLVGQEYKQTTAPYPVFDDTDALCEYLQREPLRNCRILLKGSRGNKLEKVIPLL